MTSLALRALAVLLASALTGGIATMPHAAAADDAAFIARALPRLIHRGGPFLRHPRIVTLTFAGDDDALVTRLARFGDGITRTPWWRAVTDGLCTAAGDCIGDGRPGTHVVLDRTLAATVHANDVAALLKEALAAGMLGALDGETLLLVYLPDGIALTDAFVPRYCGGGPRAFHRALRLPDRTIPYAVVPRCGDEADLTATASHEILEAAANPDPSERGFAFAGGSATAGFGAAGVEPVDPCGLVTQNGHRTMESGFTVQRAWSNAAAARGGDPCVPAANSDPYLALVPAEPSIRLTQLGETTTVTVVAAASRSVGPWRVGVVDLGAASGAPSFEVTLDRDIVRAGETATLSIALRATSRNGQGLIGLVSETATTRTLWPLAIVVH